MDSKEIIGNAMEEVLDEEFAEYISTLPIYADHQFSERHNRKMSKLIRIQRKPYFNLISTAGRRAACIVVAFIVLSASALSVKAIREAFFDFIINIFSDHNVVTVESGTESGYPKMIEKEYYISNLPDEFTETDYSCSDISVTHIYSSFDKYVIFSQHTKSDYKTFLDNEKTQYTELEDSGTVYLTAINDSDMTFIWDDGTYILQITGNLDKSDMINLCKYTKIK